MINVLIVEDSDERSGDCALALDSAVYKVHIAAGIQNGFAIARRYIPDVIVCHFINDEDGFAFVENVNRSTYTQNIPIIFLSRNADFSVQRTAMNIGADDFLVMPCFPGDFAKAVANRVMKHKRLKDQLMRMCRESFESDGELPRRDDHILVTIGNKLQLIQYSEIICITASKEYSTLHTADGQKILIRKSLKSWVETLPAKEFLRIHRASIINVGAIEKIKKVKPRTYVVFLQTMKEPLEFSQRYANMMRNTFR